MRQLMSYVFVHPDYFESLSEYRLLPVYHERLRALLPGDWEVTRGDIWLMAHREGIVIPPQGFKIHISAIVDRAEETLDRVVPACVAHEVAFKTAGDPRMLSLIGSKNYGRGSSGKFMTIYPRDVAAFRLLIEDLYERTRGLEGAYILSDRRYRDSRVVFYRYGGFSPAYTLSAQGTRDPVIRAPDGTPVPDVRLPYFKLPDWVEDPFGNEPVAHEGDHVLNGRYRIEEALSFSNAGGVYRAADLRTGRTVVVKEGRPFTACWTRGGVLLDAVGVLEREYALLTRLEGLPVIPRAVDLFREWEHTFLVEEFVEGTPLAQYRAREDVALLPFTGDPARTLAFCRTFRELAQRLLGAVRMLHDRDVLIGDLSPGNVIVDPETLDITLIDFESACDLTDPNRVDHFSSVWATIGFRTRERLSRGTLTREDDYFALGMLLYSLVIPVQNLFELEPAAQQRFLERIAGITGLPPEVARVIVALVEAQPDEALRILSEWDLRPTAARARRRRPADRVVVDLDDVAARLPEVCDRIAQYVLGTADPRRRDRLWPPDYKVFQTNPLSVAYGACGAAALLRDVRGQAPAEAEEWMIAQPIDTGAYPPGLFIGLAGVAHTFWELGYADRALDVLDQAYRHPLLFADPAMFDGAAGWGSVSLQFHAWTDDPRHLDMAVRAGEHVLACAEADGDGLYWKNAGDGHVHFGYGYGASGIGLFLLALSEATGEARYREAAVRAVEFEIGKASDIGGVPKWGSYQGHALVEPYWLHGGAGIGSVLVRFARTLGSERYRTLAEAVARGNFARFTVLPAQFEGLSGIGEFMLDMHQLTGAASYRERALEIADSILCYAIERPEGLAFPGRHLLRISTDFGYGSAGVGLFLHRLTSPGPRRWLDLRQAGHRSNVGAR